MLAIAAQIPSHELGTGYFQETRPEHLFAECSHYCETVSQPDHMPRVLEIAIQTALARRGVAVIALPGDVALREAVEPAAVAQFARMTPSVCPSDGELAALATLLDGAAKVTILGGAGCAGAHAELVQLASTLQAPIVHAMRGKEFIEFDNPFDVGMTGLIGFASGYHAMMGCDVLLMLGTDFPYRQFLPKDAKIVQIDVRGEQLGRRARLDQGLVGDVRSTLRALIPRLDPARGRPAPPGRARPLSEGAREPRRAGGRRAGQEAHPSPVRGPDGQRAGRRRTRSSPATWGPRRSGPRATWR